ncbi:MAG: hypothetical protein ABIC68_02470 [Candidatus Omnitrophota bacterium]
MKRLKMAVCFAALFVFILPVLLFAGGNDGKQSLQQKIQSKIKTSNVQYNLDVVSPGPESYEAPCEAILAQTEEDEFSSYDNKDVKPCVAKQEKQARRNRRATVERKEPSVSQLSAYAVYRTSYKAELEEDVVTIKGDVFFEVFNKGWTKIPLVRSSVGLIDVSINKGTSFVTMDGGQYYMMVDKPGKYNLNLEFLIKAKRERENGPGSFTFEILPAPISQYEFVMFDSDVEIFVEPSIKTEVKRENKKTVAWAVMPNTRQITTRWTKALPKETITPVELEPKVYVDTATYVSIGEGVIRCQAQVNYSILQSEVSNFRVALPQDVSVLDVNGRDLRDWKVSQKDKVQYLDVYLNFGVRGKYVLNLEYERRVGDGSLVAQIPVLETLGVEREKGYFGVAAATNVELAVNKLENASLIDVKELPPAIWRATANPILLAFKYLKTPYSIFIDVTKHSELPVLVAAVDSVEYITLQTAEGKNLTKAIYRLRNNVKQFLHLELPAKTVLWSAFVAGKPVKPAMDKKGSILIPLEKSQLSGESLAQFPVEIVYLDQTPKMNVTGSLKIRLPRVDIPVSQLEWLVYLPLDYNYFSFDGNVKEQKGRYFGKAYSKELYKGKKDKYVGKRNRGMVGTLAEGQFDEEQVENVMEFAQQTADNEPLMMRSGTRAGTLPIKIDVPQEGRLYRFRKILVTENETPWMSVMFVSNFKDWHGFIWFGFFVLIALAAIMFGKKYLKQLKQNQQ